MPRALPAELTDRIIDFHWDEPPTLRSCALTCRTWRAKSEYYLKAYHSLFIQSVADLILLSKRFARPESRRFYRDIKDMDILESDERPFTRIVPLCIPGSFVPRLRTIRIWSLKRQGLSIGNQWHRSFFSLLSAYKSVTRLSVQHSQFHDVEELRWIIKALPALRDIELTGVDFPHPPPSLATNRLEFGRRSEGRRQLYYLTLRSGLIPHPYHRVSNCLPALLCCAQLFSEIEQLTVDAEHGITALSRENMHLARFPIFQLTVAYTIPSMHSDLAAQWYRRLQLDVDGKDGWIHRCLLPKDVSETSDSAAGDSDGAATRLTHNMHLEAVEYMIYVEQDYSDLSLTVQTIVAMLSRGVGQYVSKLCVSLYFLKEDFLPYPDGFGSVIPHPLSRETALVRGALQHVQKISLDIHNLRIGPGQNVPTPVTSAAARIIPPLFPHWTASGDLLVEYPPFDGQDGQSRETTDLQHATDGDVTSLRQSPHHV